MDFNLTDGFRASGTNMQKFEELLKQIDDCTSALPVDMTSISFASLQETEDQNHLIFKMIDAPQTIAGRLPALRKMSIEKLEQRNVSQEIIEETRKGSRLFMVLDNAGYWTSGNLSLGIAARADLQGDGAYSPCDELYSLLMRRYVAKSVIKPTRGTLIIREAEGISKAFACFSGRYRHVPQSILCDFIKGFGTELGNAECAGWEVTQFLTDITIEFPSVADDISKTYELKDEFVPGVRLTTSDTGASSIRAVGTLRHGKSRIYVDEFTRKHSGEIDLGKLHEDVDKTIFQNYTKLPARLCDLMSIDINDPADCMERVLEQMGLEDCIGKRIAEKLVEELLLEINPAIKYTAYDIAVSIMDLPGRYYEDVATSTVEKLAGFVHKAAFADFTKVNRPIAIGLTA